MPLPVHVVSLPAPCNVGGACSGGKCVVSGEAEEVPCSNQGSKSENRAKFGRCPKGFA
jgi:hypothetical protein